LRTGDSVLSGKGGDEMRDDTLCRCGHPKHPAQCPHRDGCWCDVYADEQCEIEDWENAQDEREAFSK